MEKYIEKIKSVDGKSHYISAKDWDGHDISDLVIVKGDGENSAVLDGEYNGYSNKAISQTSVALGAGSTAGLKGWYYINVYIDTNNNYVISLNEDRYLKMENGVGIYTYSTDKNIPLIQLSNFYDNSIIDKTVSLRTNKVFENALRVVAINENTITCELVDIENNPFNNDEKNYIETPYKKTKTDAVYSHFALWCTDLSDKGSVELGTSALSEGYLTKSAFRGAHSEGNNTVAYGLASHAEGSKTKSGYIAHAEGNESIASGWYSHAEGNRTISSGECSHAEGYQTQSNGVQSHAEGRNTIASGHQSHAEGDMSNASGGQSHAEGLNTVASGHNSHAEGKKTQAIGESSHSSGFNTTANGENSFATGNESIADGNNSFAGGTKTTSSGENSFAIGNSTRAIGKNSFASGNSCVANGSNSFTIGTKNTASGEHSFAIGAVTIADGYASTAVGNRTVANNSAEFACGKYNASSSNTLFSIGSGSSENNRKNTFEVNQNGDIYINGLGGYTGDNSDSSSNLVEVIVGIDDKIDEKISKLIDNAPETYDTLKEISDYISSDKDHAVSVITQLSTLDEKIETKVKTSDAIQVAGGPLANDILTDDFWPADWYEIPGDKTTVRIIPANTSFDDILRTLFLRELEGTVEWTTPSWNPSVGQPSVNLSSSGSLEAGVKIKITKTTAGSVSSNTRSATCSASYGYFLADVEGNPTGSHNTNTSLTKSKTGSSDGIVSYTYTWNSNGVNAGDEMQVKDNSNKLNVSQSGPTVSVDALPTTKVFASTNTKKPISNTYATLTDTKPADIKLTNSKEYIITGVRYAFTGAVASGFVANSANIRRLTKNGYSASALTKMTASEGNAQIIIAFPSSWGSLNEVKDNKALGADITGNFILTPNIPVEGANGYTAVDYKVYIYTSGVTLGEIDYTISIK